jgi:hydroxymethylbilane synthase
LHLSGLVGSAHDGRAVRSAAFGDEPDALGRQVARQLLDLGAGEFIAPLR